MARTKASVGAKVSAGKSSKARCSAAPPPSVNSASAGDKSSRSYSGGNSVCPRETPKWQKPITNFFIGKATKQSYNDDEAAGSSKSKPKRNIIHSDDESDSEESNKRNTNESDEKESNLNKSKGIESDLNKSTEIESNLNKSTEVESDLNKSTEIESDLNKVTEEEIETVESQVYEYSQEYGIADSPPKNKELDESIILEPLTGENSHKLDEYYPKDTKGKGIGKKSKENNNNKVSFKRHSEDIETPNAKKIKVI